MKFYKLVETLLNEDLVSGGESSVFGSGASLTSSAFSGDTYAPNDARVPKSIYGKAVLTRYGATKFKKTKKKK